MSQFFTNYITGEWEPLMNIYFPILDQSGKLGWILIQMDNIANFYYVSISGVIPFEMIVFFALTNLMLSAPILKRDLADLKTMLVNPQIPQTEIKRRFFNVILSHRAYNG